MDMSNLRIRVVILSLALASKLPINDYSNNIDSLLASASDSESESNILKMSYMLNILPAVYYTCT